MKLNSDESHKRSSMYSKRKWNFTNILCKQRYTGQ